MVTYLNIVQIIISVVLTLAVLLQAKGTALGSVFGNDASSVFRTRRGVQKTLFQFTIILAFFFIVVSLVSVRVAA